MSKAKTTRLSGNSQWEPSSMHDAINSYLTALVEGGNESEVNMYIGLGTEVLLIVLYLVFFH